MKETQIIIPAKTDQFPIAATLFEPTEEKNCQIFCVISAATGIKRGYYANYASFLCKEYGITSLIYDYRGIGDSKPNPKAPPKNMKADIVDWCRKDIAGVFDWVFDKYHPQYQVVVVSNSVGGHAHGIMYPYINQKIARMLTVSVNQAYLGYFKWNSTLLFTLFSFFMARSILSYYYGFFPGKTLFGAMEDLPSDVAKQWAWFMRHRNYFVKYDNPKEPLHPEGFESFYAPILSFSFDNDNVAPKKQFDIFHKRFVNCEHLVRKHYRSYKCGHVDFFRSSTKDSTDLWHQSAKFLVSGCYPPKDDPSVDVTLEEFFGPNSKKKENSEGVNSPFISKL